LYSEKWEDLRKLLREARRNASLTQSEVARELQRPQSLVAKIEAGERKLDVCQFIEYLKVLNADPVEVMRRLCETDENHKRQK
jgi:transcriptional regulator with XRE-family HTH domain